MQSETGRQQSHGHAKRKGSGDGSLFKRKVRQYLATIGAILPLFVYGLDVGWISPAMLTLKTNGTVTDTPLTNEQISWITSLPLVGAVVGVFLYSYVAELRGRKLAIILMSIPQLISWLLRIYFVTAPWLIVSKFLSGLAYGGAISIIPLYIKEISDQDSRPFLVALAIFMFKVGMLVALTTGAVFSYFTNIWIFTMVPIAHLALFPSAPESPAYLLNAGRKEEAMEAVAWLRQLQPSDKRVFSVIEMLEQENIQISESNNVSIKDALKDKCTYRALKINAVLQTALGSNGAIVAVVYASHIFKKAGGSMPPNVQSIFVGIAQIAGSLIAVVLVKKFGSRMLMLGTHMMMAFWMLILGIWFLLQSLGILYPTWIPMLAVCMAIFSNAISVPMGVMLKIELFPYRVRTLMACMAMLINLSTIFIATRIYQPLDTYLGPHSPFFIYATCTIIILIYLYINLPEIKNKSFEQIKKQIMFGIENRHGEGEWDAENVNMVKRVK